MLMQKGQSVIEILVAMGIFVLVSNAAVLLFFGGQSLSLDSMNAQFALDYAAEGMEVTQSIRERSWDELTDGDYGLVFNAGENKWELSGTDDSKKIFTRKVTIVTLSENTKKITTEIAWQTDPLRPQTITLVEQFINWEVAQQESENLGGDTGGGGTIPYWSNPQTLGTVDVGAGGQATDLDVLNKIVYLTSKASDKKKDDFFVIDVTDGQNPVVTGRINTGLGLNAVDAAGNYAYVANDDKNAQLQVIAITGPVVPDLKTNYRLGEDNAACENDDKEGNTIFYYAQKVYLGTNKASGDPEFHIIDVSNPLNPTSLGCEEINEDVNAIYVKDNYAYLATSGTELLVYNISDPANITLAGSFDAPGSSEDGKSIQLIGNTLYLGREQGGRHDDHHELHILNVTDLSNIQDLEFRRGY